MTTERIITELYKIIALLPEEDRKAIFELNKTNERFKLNYLPALFSNLIKDLDDDLRNENAKKNGKTAMKKAAEKILKQRINKQI